MYSIYSDPILPLAVGDLSVRKLQRRPPVLLVVLPLSLVDSSVGKLQSSKSVLLIVLEVAIVEFAVGPDVLALPVPNSRTQLLLIGDPLSLVDLAVRARVLPQTLDVVVSELSLVDRPVGPNELSDPVLLPALVNPLEIAASSFQYLPSGHFSTPFPCCKSCSH